MSSGAGSGAAVQPAEFVEAEELTAGGRLRSPQLPGLTIPVSELLP